MAFHVLIPCLNSDRERVERRLAVHDAGDNLHKAIGKKWVLWFAVQDKSDMNMLLPITWRVLMPSNVVVQWVVIEEF